MLKKLISFILCAAMLASVFMFTGCSNEVVYEDEDTRLPLTLTMLGIKGATTTDEAVQEVEDAINVITRDRYEIKLDLIFVTEDQYMNLVRDKAEEAEHYKNVDAAIKIYNDYEKALASTEQSLSSQTSSKRGKWTKRAEAIEAATVATRAIYTEQSTTRYENGKIEVVYPNLTNYPGSVSPVDIIMIPDKEAYDEFDSNGWLESVKTLLSLGSGDVTYTKLNQYVYPTYFSELQAITGDVKAVPNNNLLAEYTYLLLDRELADKYDADIDMIDNYDDLSEFLASVKAGESVVPLAGEPEPLGIFKLFGDDVAIGTYFDPIYGYNEEEGKSFKVQSLFSIKEYTDYLALMDGYRAAGYIGSADIDSGFAAKAVKGDATVVEKYSDKYYVKVIQNPFVCEEAIFDGMLAVSSYTSDAARTLQIIEMINTDPEIKNLLQYGIEGVNYAVNDDGETIRRLNNTYMMDNKLTGNVYMGYPEEGVNATLWDNYKLTNLASSLSPFLTFYVSDSDVDDLLTSSVKYACLNDAFIPVGFTYEEYLSNYGTLTGNDMIAKFRNHYRSFFSGKLMEAGVPERGVDAVINNLNNSVYTTAWFENQLIEKIKAEKYSGVSTSAGLATKVNEKLASVIGMAYTNYDKARSDSVKYYTNIQYLRIMTKMTVLSELSEAEIAVFDAMSDSEFENAIYEYIKSNYIEENDIDDDKYEQLVENFISSMLQFTDAITNETYYITWDEFLDVKKDAQAYIEAMEKLKAEYNDELVTEYSQASVDSFTSVELGKKTYTMLYKKWLADNGTSQTEFENGIKDEILAPFNITSAELTKLRRTDATAYESYLAKIKSKYKSIYLETYTLEEYKAGTTVISKDEVMNAVLRYKVEEKTGLYDHICDVIGLSYKEYVKDEEYMTLYVKYLDMMKTKFIYTLLTDYTQSEINNFTYEETEKVVYETVYNKGFYMNILANCVGYSLRDYMLAKSNAKTYTNAIKSLVDYFSADIKALGYDIDKFAAMNPDEIEEVVKGIIEEKYFGDVMTLEEKLAVTSAPYIKGLSEASDRAAYAKEAAEALGKDALFTSVVTTLEKNRATALDTAE